MACAWGGPQGRQGVGGWCSAPSLAPRLLPALGVKPTIQGKDEACEAQQSVAPQICGGGPAVALTPAGDTETGGGDNA